MALSDVSLRSADLVAIGGIADTPRTCLESGYDVIDPKRTKAGLKSRGAVVYRVDRIRKSAAVRYHCTGASYQALATLDDEAASVAKLVRKLAQTYFLSADPQAIELPKPGII
jgi:hypothetical protein